MTRQGEGRRGARAVRAKEDTEIQGAIAFSEDLAAIQAVFLIALLSFKWRKLGSTSLYLQARSLLVTIVSRKGRTNRCRPRESLLYRSVLRIASGIVALLERCRNHV